MCSGLIVTKSSLLYRHIDRNLCVSMELWCSLTTRWNYVPVRGFYLFILILVCFPLIDWVQENIVCPLILCFRLILTLSLLLIYSLHVSLECETRGCSFLYVDCTGHLCPADMGGEFPPLSLSETQLMTQPLPWVIR